MLRRISRNFGSQSRRKEEETRQSRMNQDKIERDLMQLAQDTINKEIATKADMTAVTRQGTSLFQPKSKGSAEVGQELDRTLYEMPMPENADALTDLIKLHQDGDKFPYVGIVGQEGESLDARRARLLSLKPKIGIRNIPEIVVTGCPLIDTEGEFSMYQLMEHAKVSEEPVQPQSSLLPKTSNTKDYNISKKYVHIKSVTGLYTPTMSSTADFCKLWFFLLDGRLINQNKSGQSNALVSNQEGVMELSCDYCVSTTELNSFVLGYTLEREILSPGFQWGSITFYFNITESDIPYQSAKRDALAVYRMPISTLVERKTNADKSDISFTANDMAAMRRLYLNGDIVDADQPQQARLKKSTYSKSTLRGLQKGEDLNENIAERDGWGFMKGAKKPLMTADVASVDIEDGDDDSTVEVNLKSKQMWEREQERLRMEQGVDMEAMSDKQSSKHEEDIAKPPTPPASHKRNVSFSADSSRITPW